MHFPLRVFSCAYLPPLFLHDVPAEIALAPDVADRPAAEGVQRRADLLARQFPLRHALPGFCLSWLREEFQRLGLFAHLMSAKMV